MQFKSLKLVLAMAGCFLTAPLMAVDTDKKADEYLAKVTHMNVTAKDKNGEDFTFEVFAECGQSMQDIGKIILSDEAAKDEALLLRYKYGPEVAEQFLTHWNSKASEFAPRLPTMAMLFYPKKDHPLASLLEKDGKQQQRVNDYNSNDSYKIMVAQDKTTKSKGNSGNGQGEIVLFICGDRKHPPREL